jgi:hypothetical protein
MLALGVTLAACGDDNKNDPKVSFSSPMSRATVNGGEVTAKVDLENFDIDTANVGKAKADGKGHLHFSLDGGKYDKPKYSGANGDLAVKLGVEGKYSPATEPQITYKGIPAGDHTLRVQVANNDHSETGKEDTVTFTAERDSEAAAAFSSPADGDTVSSRFIAKVDLQNFQIDAKNVGKAKADGNGHLHFSLDNGKFDKPKYSGPNGDLAVQLGVDGKYSPATEPQITYSDIPPGEHTLKIMLANNDHSDTDTEASTTFMVE